VVSSRASQQGAWLRFIRRIRHVRWRRHIWLAAAAAGVALVALLCVDAWRYGDNAHWLDGHHAWYQWWLQPGRSLTLIVTILLWLVALTGFWLPRRRARQPMSLIIVGVMVLIAAALGVTSFVPCRGDVSTAGVLFWVLQLYVGQPPEDACTAAPPLGLQLGQMVGLGATLIGALVVGSVLWREPLERLGLWFTQETTVLIGLDEMTLPVLRRLAAPPRPRTLIVLEPDETNPLLDEARATGARVIVGEQPWCRLLRPIIAGRHGCSLSYLYALRADVAANETVLEAVKQILDRYHPAPERLPQLMIRIDDPRHANSWRGSNGGNIELGLADALSPAETTAYALLDRILHEARETAEADEIPAQHLIICGDGNLAIALLLELDRRTWERHELGRPPLPVRRVTLLDPKSADTLREYQAGAPRESPAPFPAVDTCPDRWLDRLLPLLDEMSPSARQQTAVVITDGPAEAGTQAAGRAARLHPATAFYLQAATGDGITGPVFDQLHQFRLSLLIEGEVPKDAWTRIARHWHACHGLSNPRPGTDSRRDWDELDKFYRLDNMLQVRSILSAVATLGRTWVPTRALVPGSFIELTDGEIGEVAKIEHGRWLRRQLERGTGNKLAEKWDDLPDEADRTRSKDEVRKQVTQLEMAGFIPVIRRGGPPEAESYERTGFVQARQLHAPLRWTVRSGEQLRGNPGDWHVTDDQGRVRTATDPEFRDSHKDVGRGRWRRTGTFRAWPASEGLVVRSKEGKSTAEPGDWVVESPAGERWLVPARQFAETYRRAAEGDEAATPASPAERPEKAG
jgi:hypothetical protein